MGVMFSRCLATVGAMIKVLRDPPSGGRSWGRASSDQLSILAGQWCLPSNVASERMERASGGEL